MWAYQRHDDRHIRAIRNIYAVRTAWHGAPRWAAPRPYTAPWTTGSVYMQPSEDVSDYMWTL